MQPGMRFLEDPPRFLFFTGKGGVGKTSLACATAVTLAEQGKWPTRRCGPRRCVTERGRWHSEWRSSPFWLIKLSTRGVWQRSSKTGNDNHWAKRLPGRWSRQKRCESRSNSWLQPATVSTTCTGPAGGSRLTGDGSAHAGTLDDWPSPGAVRRGLVGYFWARVDITCVATNQNAPPRLYVLVNWSSVAALEVSFPSRRR